MRQYRLRAIFFAILIANSTAKPLQAFTAPSIARELAQILKDRCGLDSGRVAQAEALLAPDFGSKGPEVVKAGLSSMLKTLGLPPDIVHHRSEQSFWLYHELKDLPAPEGSRGPTQDAWFERRGRRWYVARVFPNASSATLAMKRGNEVVIPSGATLPWLAATKKMTLNLRETPWSPVKSATVPASRDSYATLWMAAGKQSTFVTTRAGVEVGYLPVFSAYRPQEVTWIAEQVRRMASQAKALVLDFRNGFGGDSSGILPLFMTEGRKRPAFHGPMIILINQGTRGNLVWSARQARAGGQAILVGGRAGPDYVREESLLFGEGAWLINLPFFKNEPPSCALMGEALEPDIAMDDPLVYAAGADPLVEDALELAARSVAVMNAP